ncbi:MAG: hypothetical protein EOQ40_14655 [Mesorhizobium sp.]|nr:MAG: hypothetical protein EOQ40_14655 [Mesorhizobium sp.]
MAIGEGRCDVQSPPCGGDARQGRGGCCPSGLSTIRCRIPRQVALEHVRPRSRSFTPLWPAGHLPRKGGDWQLRRPASTSPPPHKLPA